MYVCTMYMYTCRYTQTSSIAHINTLYMCVCLVMCRFCCSSHTPSLYNEAAQTISHWPQFFRQETSVHSIVCVSSVPAHQDRLHHKMEVSYRHYGQCVHARTVGTARTCRYTHTLSFCREHFLAFLSVSITLTTLNSPSSHSIARLGIYMYTILNVALVMVLYGATL